MLTKSSKSILRALALILAVLMAASVCLVGCTDKNAQAAADEAKTAADAAKALAQEAKDAATSAVSEKTLSDELAKAVDQAKAQATADIKNALSDYAKQADLDALSAEAIKSLSAELAKKVNTGDVYTKAEIDSKLAALGGNTATGDASAAIEKALKDAKAYTDAAIAKIGTGAASGDLSEGAIATIIEAAFEDFDKVTAELVLAVGKIYMDVVKIMMMSYRPADFVELYSYVSEYIALDLDGKEFTGAIEQQTEKVFNLYSAVPTLLALLRMSSSEKLAKVVADFDKAAAVVSIDDKLNEIAEMILEIGTQKELKNVPAEYVTITDGVYSIGYFDAEEEYKLPVVVSYAEYNNTNTDLHGVIYKEGNEYKKGDLIYVAVVADKKIVAYDVLRVTADTKKAGATPTDFAEAVSVAVVTVNDMAKYDAVAAKVDEFVAWGGIVDKDGTVYVDTKEYDRSIIAKYADDAFTVVDGEETKTVVADFDEFGWSYEKAKTTAKKGEINLLISYLTSFMEDGYYIFSSEDGNTKAIQSLLGISADADFIYIDDEAEKEEGDHTFGFYVEYFFDAASDAYDFAAHHLVADFITPANATLTDANGKVLSVVQKYPNAEDPEAAYNAYKALVEELEAAIADYELFNLGANKDITAIKANLVLAKAYMNSYNINEARQNRETANKEAYMKALTEMVNYLTVEYMSNTDAYVNKTEKFIAAADTIIKDTYFEAVMVSYETALPTIEAYKKSTFAANLAAYMAEKYYTPALNKIQEAYAEYSWWLTIQAQTEGYLTKYIDMYKAKAATATDSNVAYYVSKTDSTANLYYTIGEILFGCEKAGDKAAYKGQLTVIAEKLTADIAAFMAVEPAKGTYHASCLKVLAMIDAAVLDVAEKYVSVADTKYGYKAAALAAAQADFESFKAEMFDLLKDTGVVTLGLKADIVKLEASLKAVAALNAKYPVMSLVGDDEAVTSTDTEDYSKLFNFENQYAVALNDYKSTLLKLVYETWFTAAQNKCYEEMSAYYKGSEGGVLHTNIVTSKDTIACMNDMSQIFNAAYKDLYAQKLVFTIPSYKLDKDNKVVYLDKDGKDATEATAAAVKGVDFATMKAYCLAADKDIQALVSGQMNNVILPAMRQIVTDCDLLLLSYAENRKDYEQYVYEAQLLVDAIKALNTTTAKDLAALAGFYVTGSKFDKALNNLQAVINNAKYVVGVAYTVDATATTGKVFVTATDKIGGVKFEFDLTDGYKAADKTWTAEDYYDTRMYVAWSIASAEYAMYDLWINSNPLHNNSTLDPVAKVAAEAKFTAIQTSIGAALAAYGIDPNGFLAK